jgi:hypothetical protein
VLLPVQLEGMPDKLESLAFNGEESVANVPSLAPAGTIDEGEYEFSLPEARLFLGAILSGMKFLFEE